MSRHLRPSWVGVGFATVFGACFAGPDGGSAGSFSHDDYFVITGSHQGFTCDRCHPVGAPSFTYAAGGVACFSCHPEIVIDPAHNGMPGYAYDFYACLSCHKTGVGMPQTITVGGFTVSEPPATVPTLEPGIDGLPHPTVATGEACTPCHPAGQASKPASGYDHASPLIAQACSACHEAGSDLVSTPWNGAATSGAGRGDTRPYTLALSNPCNVSATSMHFYPPTGVAAALGDCGVCHTAPSGNGTTTTGSAYSSAWRFRHPPESGSASAFPCSVCHVNSQCGG